ncbi:MAG: DUF1858 domain-containing protein [Oscillospiraceae bacterium]|nr:DUF1858 domain-containing protein [Oscillospiraceae bacterium]
MQVTKDTIIGDILDFNSPAAAPLFIENGMHCLGCPAARSESVGEACNAHNVSPDELINKLNQVLNQ